jgi:hypothetical protein
MSELCVGVAVLRSQLRQSSRTAVHPAAAITQPLHPESRPSPKDADLGKIDRAASGSSARFWVRRDRLSRR